MAKPLSCWHGVQILPGHAPIHRCADCEAQSAIDKRDQRFLWLYPLKGARVAIKLHPMHGEKIPGEQVWKPGEFEAAWKAVASGGFRPMIFLGDKIPVAQIFLRAANFPSLSELRARIGKLARPSND